MVFNLLKKSFSANINKVNGRLDVLQACAAAGALVAAGDGNASESEEAITIKTIKANEMMASFNPKQVEQIVAKSFDKAETGRSGRHALMKEIKDVSDDPDVGEVVLILALDVAEANGGIEDGERKVLDLIAGELGLKLDNFI